MSAGTIPALRSVYFRRIFDMKTRLFRACISLRLHLPTGSVFPTDHSYIQFTRKLKNNYDFALYVLNYFRGRYAHRAGCPQWRGPNRDGSTPAAGPETWPERLKQVWKFRVGKGTSPVVAGNRIFQLHDPGDQEVILSMWQPVK